MNKKENCPVSFYEKLHDKCCQMHQQYFKDKLNKLKKENTKDEQHN